MTARFLCVLMTRLFLLVALIALVAGGIGYGLYLLLT
jgi:hypothetical protein